MFFRLLIVSFLFFPNLILSQQVLLVHEPFSLRDNPSWQYSRDTIVFESDAKIWGLVYLDTLLAEKQISLEFKNAYNLERTATFLLQPLQANRLNWEASIKKWWQPIFGK